MVDATNAFGVPLEQLDGLPSSAVVAPPPALDVRIRTERLGGQVVEPLQVVFLSSDDEGAAAPVKALAERLGFAPVWLGKLAEGGALVQARGRTWAPLVFQDLVKFGDA